MVSYQNYVDNHGRDRYFEWLMDDVKGSYYDTMLFKLHSVNFLMDEKEMDLPRIQDALSLRKQFVKETGGHFEIVNVPKHTCTFLELLIAMSARLENDILHELDKGDRHIDWFWMFIDNLGLTDATNDHWTYSLDRYVDKRCKNIVERSFGRNGQDGLFIVLSHPDKDLRTIDLWTQMCWWVMENIKKGVID